MDLNNLDDAEQFQRMFVTPLIEAVRKEICPLIRQVEDNEARIKTMEKNQKRALIGYGGIVAVAALLATLLKEWVQNNLPF
jgi:hypothetical protein